MRGPGTLLLIGGLLAILASHCIQSKAVPLVVNTWPFTGATKQGWATLQRGSAMDAVEQTALLLSWEHPQGCAACEVAQCDRTVGYGGSPDESGATTLDAMIMDGSTMAAGAVANLQHTRQAVSAARAVLEHTTHTLLSGGQADAFAAGMGFTPRNLSTEESLASWHRWQDGTCQPNFRRNVSPDPAKSCGPYSPTEPKAGSSACPQQATSSWPSPHSHDTISIIAINAHGHLAAASSSNGAVHKVPGRVGDAAIPGGGAYAAPWGACGSTGDGDLHIRFQPCLLAVEALKRGHSPQQAAEGAVARIVSFYPSYVGALVVTDPDGNIGAACHGWQFQYSMLNSSLTEPLVVDVDPLQLPGSVDTA